MGKVKLVSLVIMLSGIWPSIWNLPYFLMKPISPKVLLVVSKMAEQEKVTAELST